MDAHTKFIWLYLLQTKSQAFTTFVHFKTMVENQFNTKIKGIQSDGGKEYSPFTKYLISHGIPHRLSCPYTSEQNDSAERKHRHITEIGLTLLANASMPLRFGVRHFRLLLLL